MKIFYCYSDFLTVKCKFFFFVTDQLNLKYKDTVHVNPTLGCSTDNMHTNDIEPTEPVAKKIVKRKNSNEAGKFLRFIIMICFFFIF